MNKCFCVCFVFQDSCTGVLKILNKHVDGWLFVHSCVVCVFSPLRLRLLLCHIHLFSFILVLPHKLYTCISVSTCTTIHLYMCVCVRVLCGVCVCVCVRACVRACVWLFPSFLPFLPPFFSSFRLPSILFFLPSSSCLLSILPTFLSLNKQVRLTRQGTRET